MEPILGSVKKSELLRVSKPGLKTAGECGTDEVVTEEIRVYILVKRVDNSSLCEQVTTSNGFWISHTTSNMADPESMAFDKDGSMGKVMWSLWYILPLAFFRLLSFQISGARWVPWVGHIRVRMNPCPSLSKED